jgi:predicted phage terminase large subunit-like protein
MLTNEEQIELLYLLSIKDYELAEKSLSNFIKSAWPILEPKNQYVHNWHIDLITEHLEAVSQGQIKRLIVNIPPRYMKSLCVSVMWPVWSWIKSPEMRWIFSSYSQSLSTKHSVDRRQLIQSDWFQKRWQSRFMLAEDQNQKTEFLNSKRGHMVSTSVGGTVTGKGADIIVVDDPHNPLEASSEVLRKKAIEFFDQTLTTRLDNKKEGSIVVVMQRLHEEDLTGHLGEQKTWTHLSVPAVFEAKTIYSFPVSKKIIEFNEGDVLFNERESSEDLKKQKAALGSIAFAAQYQQQPSPAEGAIVKKEWFKFYSQMPEKFDEIIQSWDMSFKDSENSDYVVGQVWGRIGANKYLLDQVRKKLNFPDTLKAVIDLSNKWPKARRKLIEDKANGTAIIASLSDKISGIVPISPTESKLSRMSAICPQIESGNVYLPDSILKTWVDDFLDEILRFPKGKHDDQCDCLSQALIELDKSIRNTDWILGMIKF